ncbi:MAG: SAM-dependent methyltransferase, partial [Acidobacteria bacterium]
MATVSEALESSRRLWDAHAQSDPLWAILSDPAKHGGKWNLHRFFQTGVGEIATLLYELARLGVAVKTDRALDFGCGIGRLTQALAERFTRV